MFFRSTCRHPFYYGGKNLTVVHIRKIRGYGLDIMKKCNRSPTKSICLRILNFDYTTILYIFARLATD